MRRALAALAVASALAGCVGQMSPMPSAEFEPQPEKTLYFALKDIKADDAQRMAVLNAFDRFDAVLRGLQARSDQVIGEWRALDRHDPVFTTRVEPLAQRMGAMAAERMNAEAQFEKEVAAALTPQQWDRWQAFMQARVLNPMDRRALERSIDRAPR